MFVCFQIFLQPLFDLFSRCFRLLLYFFFFFFFEFFTLIKWSLSFFFFLSKSCVPMLRLRFLIFSISSLLVFLYFFTFTLLILPGLYVGFLLYISLLHVVKIWYMWSNLSNTWLKLAVFLLV